MAGVSNEAGDKVWDPLGLGTLSETVKGPHGGVMPHAKWLREAELKHGRGAMLAFVGTCVAEAGVIFPGEMGGYYYKAGSWADGLSSAMATNPFGMAQLLLSIGLVEVPVASLLPTSCSLYLSLYAASNLPLALFLIGGVVLRRLLVRRRRPRAWGPQLLPLRQEEER